MTGSGGSSGGQDKQVSRLQGGEKCCGTHVVISERVDGIFREETGKVGTESNAAGQRGLQRCDDLHVAVDCVAGPGTGITGGPNDNAGLIQREKSTATVETTGRRRGGGRLSLRRKTEVSSHSAAGRSSSPLKVHVTGCSVGIGNVTCDGKERPGGFDEIILLV